MTQRYDEANHTLWVACDLDADSLFPSDELAQLSALKRAGKTQDGKPLAAVNIVFSDLGCAEYNASALGFSHIGTFVGALDAPQPFGDSPNFGTKNDFGM